MAVTRIQEAEEKLPGTYQLGPGMVPAGGVSMRVSVPRSGLGWMGLKTSTDVISVMIEVSNDLKQWKTWGGFTMEGGEKMTGIGVVMARSRMTGTRPKESWYRVILGVSIFLNVAVDIE